MNNQQSLNIDYTLLHNLRKLYDTSQTYAWYAFLVSLDYVKDANIYYHLGILFFETEQDKMFFLLKYS